MRILLDGVSVFVDNWQLITGVFVFIIVLIFPFYTRHKTDLKPVSISTGVFLVLFIAVSLLFRLAYVSNALLPSYFDSAQHYAFIKGTMANGLLWDAERLQADYYHMGFHFIAAFFASISHMDISRTMLVLGQVILAIMPLSFFFIIWRVTQSNTAAWFSLILSAFGWYMPAHAVDWGKYPALMSMWMITLVFSLAYIMSLLHTKKRIVVSVLLGLGILVTALVHSRSLIAIGIAFAAWMVTMWWSAQPQSMQKIILLSLFVALVVEIFIIQQNKILSLLLDPYVDKSLLVTLLVVVLSIFPYKVYPRFTFAILFSVCLFLAAMFVPVNGLFPNRPYLTLLDRPYVEMILFMPLSLLGGLGLAGLEKMVKSPYQNYIALTIVGLTLIYTLARYEFYPSSCCVIVGNDDLAALAWMDGQLPVKARIGIASSELKVVAGNVSEGDVGTDAGIWVTPLIDRVSILLPNSLEFDQQTALDMICRKNVQYLFVGELGQTFDITQLVSRPVWYRPLLSISGARVYEVIGCEL